MDALRRFEAWVSDALEGRLGGLLGARIQPVDLAHRLAERMEDARAFGAGRTYVPNTYRIFLAPRTLAGFVGYQRALEDELSAFVAGRAAERDLALVGRVRVSLHADATLRAERARVEADLVDRQSLAPEADGATMAFEAVAPPAVAPAALRLAWQGRRFDLPADPGAEVRIGRALDSTLVLDNGTVSRRHARLIARGGHWHVEDRESRAGVILNGRAVTAAPIRPGDRIRLGAVVIDVEDGGAAAPAPTAEP